MVVREDIAAVLGDDHEILDPHAADARQVDARLDRDDVARRRARVSAGARQPRRLVGDEPDAVPEPVAEVLAVARGGR